MHIHWNGHSPRKPVLRNPWVEAEEGPLLREQVSPVLARAGPEVPLRTGHSDSEPTIV